MAVRPWENRFLDINSKEVKVHENEKEEQEHGIKNQLKSAGKKPVASNPQLELSNEKTGQSHYDEVGSSPVKSTSLQDVPASLTVTSKSNSKSKPLTNSVQTAILKRGHQLWVLRERNVCPFQVMARRLKVLATQTAKSPTRRKPINITLQSQMGKRPFKQLLPKFLPPDPDACKYLNYLFHHVGTELPVPVCCGVDAMIG